MDPVKIFKLLKDKDFNPFIEVPCSSLAPLISVAQADQGVDHIYPANEGIALGIASGAYLAGKKPVLLMQNSGLLNTLNGLTSLNQIYQIPVLFIISWRGYGKDAPEHELVGRDLEKYLRTFGLEYTILDEQNHKTAIEKANRYLIEQSQPYGLLIKPDYFEKKKGQLTRSTYPLTRFEAVKMVKETLLPAGYLFISTNGFISRESYETAQTDDFYMMGSMGHALPLGLGAARYSDSKIAVLDGDGAVLMHLGAMASVAKDLPRNLLHVVFDNEAYASTENQPTLTSVIALEEVARACHYKNVIKVEDGATLKTALASLTAAAGPSFLLIKVQPGNKAGVRRVSDDRTCVDIKNAFRGKAINGKK